MKRLSTGLLIAFLGVLVLAAVTRSLSLTTLLQRSERDKIEQAARDDTGTIAMWATERWDWTNENIRFGLGALATVAGARVWLVDVDGTVRVDTQGNPSWEGARVEGAELESARQGLRSTVHGRSPWLNSALACVAPVLRRNQVIGMVFLFVPEEPAPKPSGLDDALLWTAVFSIGVATAVAFMVSRAIARPFEQITQFARGLGYGQFNQTIQVDGFDEVSELAATLSKVGGQLSASFEALAGERQRLQGILQAMQEGVVAIDSSHQVTLVNDAARRLLLWPEPALPTPISETPLPERLRRALRQALEGSTQEINLQPRGKRDILAVCVPVPGPGGPGGAVGVLRDLEAVMRLQRLREQFVADVAHELRGPLTNLSLLAEAFADGTIAWGKRKPYIAALQTEVGRLRRLSSDVLDLARMDAGVMVLKLETLDLAGVVNKVIAELRSDAAASGVGLVSEVPAGTVVTAAADRMEQVLYNLVDNAVRHTSAAGHVTIRTQELAGETVIEVSDDGEGVAAEHLPHLFDRFYKVDPARTRGRGGTGLGLAVVKRLVELQMGRVEVASVQGQGAVFRVALPKGNL